MDTLVARGRRTRRLRRSLAVGGATLLFAGGSVLGVWWQTEPALKPPPLAVKSKLPRPLPFHGPYTPQPPSKPGEPLDTGPVKPATGVRYRYDLSAVCGMQYAVFDGRVWERSTDGPQHMPSLIGDRVHGYMRWTEGYRTRAEVDTATFETDSPALPPLTFHPLSGDVPSCVSQEPKRRHSDAPAAVPGPAHPRIGVRYVYDMTKDCGMRYAVFGGRLWKVPGRFAPGSLVEWVNDLPVPAHMTQVSRDRAVLEMPAFPGEEPRKITYYAVNGRGYDCS
ncbi:hypothetical protein GCM10020367_37330 [Streptomyces sannanensis]|uniref:Uncharacterized protein n=1 Tax=Streptomyces sannanensis TaxID=285536 RepID=A0ABP6SDN3_9ACTN